MTDFEKKAKIKELQLIIDKHLHFFRILTVKR